ncbi:MAG TPA: DUF2750 domain-containing protein [Fimbriimonadaceae bacterium]|nr:DUF2750 domain-containing protein [Fimbriimonadaceae bacterium]
MDEDDSQFGYELTGEELRRVIALPVEARLAYFVEKCAETGQVWSLGADEELIVLATDDDEPFVVTFPHPEFGQEWCEATELDEIELVAVTTDDWVREILPGLKEAQVMVLVSPTAESEGALLDPDALAEKFAD